MGDALTLRGILKGHNGWVTSIATTTENNDMILSASRGTTGTLMLPTSHHTLLGEI